MLVAGTPLKVKTPTGELAFTVRGHRGAGGQGILYTLSSKEGRAAVLKVPGTKAILAAEIERRILEKLPPHRNVVRYVGSAVVERVECPVLAFAHENPFHRINHPTVVPTIESFRTLRSPRIALPATTAIEIIQEVLAGLEHIHANGYVHGDIKSANVLVEISTPKTRLGNKEYFANVQQRAFTTVVIDFGTVRSAAYLANAGESDEKVVPPEFTPLYAPPEIMKRVGDTPGGPKTDVYQVGLLLYELVTGHFPYDHVVQDIAQRGLDAELIDLKRSEMQGVRRPFDPDVVMSARHHDVVFAEAFAAQRLKDRFYEGVRRIVDIATLPDPAARPSIAALRAELIRLFELEPLGVAPSEQRRAVSLANKRWHLVRTNRLSEAARVPDPIEVMAPSSESSGSAPTAPAFPGTGSNAPTMRALPAELMELAQEKGEQPAAEVSAVPRADLRAYKIALVDDDKVTLTILASTLRRRGFKVRAFQDPESALEVLSRDHPDAAIFDMQMPGLTGLELVKRLEQRIKAQPFPIMILSSEGQESTLAEAFYHGVTDYLVKPVSEAELVVKLETAMQRKKEAVPEQIPREVAGLELTEEVRRGEVAVIFRASSPEGGVTRAVKILRPELVGEAEPLLKLRREIDVMSRCDHRAISRILGSGLVGRLLYYVADEVPARTLGERVRERGKMPPTDAIAFLHDAGSVLKHLHARLIVHGDLTPESLGFTEDGTLILTELGSARWMDGFLRDDEPVPLPSRYTAPELHDSRARPDPRSDLYALGVCTLEAATGKPPLVDSGGSVDLRALAQLQPPELAALVGRLVARSPEDRFPTAAALVTALSVLHLPS